MKTVRDACHLQPNALRVKLSDQIEHLHELISAEGSSTAFFDRTFMTQGMKDLIGGTSWTGCRRRGECKNEARPSASPD